MKKVIPLSLMCLLLLGIGQAQAQTAEQPWGFKIGFGLNHYDGDLGNTMLEFHSNDFFYQMGLAYYISPHFGLALDANWFTLDKRNGPHDSVVQKRNTHFKTSDFNLNLMLRIKPFTTRLNPYIAFGVGGNFLQDRANIRNDESHFIVSIPAGIGVNYKISEQFSLNAQMIYNFTFVDDEIDNYPLPASKAVDGMANPNIDGIGHDNFMLTSVGIVFNFGGGDIEEEHPILAQSMQNLEAAQNAAELAADNLRQAQQINEQTLEALNELQHAINMSEQEANELKSDYVHIINNIQFAFDKATLLNTAKTELNSLANIMNHYPGLNIDIAGHTDKRGSKSYNRALSKRRVQSVKEFLVSHGVSASRITTSAYGETQDLLVNSADLQTTYAQNRAVQLTLSYHNPQSE